MRRTRVCTARISGTGEYMVSFDPGLYVSSGLKEKKRQLVEAFMKGEVVPGIYVIYRNETSGKAEFVKSRQLKQRYYAGRDLYVLGLAEDYDKALLYLAYYAAELAGA